MIERSARLFPKRLPWISTFLAKSIVKAVRSSAVDHLYITLPKCLIALMNLIFKHDVAAQFLSTALIKTTANLCILTWLCLSAVPSLDCAFGRQVSLQFCQNLCPIRKYRGMRAHLTLDRKRRGKLTRPSKHQQVF